MRELVISGALYMLIAERIPLISSSDANTGVSPLTGGPSGRAFPSECERGAAHVVKNNTFPFHFTRVILAIKRLYGRLQPLTTRSSAAVSVEVCVSDNILLRKNVFYTLRKYCALLIIG